MTHKRNNRVALISGASSGIGLELTKRLLSEGWQVLALIRSAFPTDDARIQDALRLRQLITYKADLSDFKDLQASLDQIKKHEGHIDLLFNNAGVSFGELSYSQQGREMHFEVNSIVPYIILMELKELLGKALQDGNQYVFECVVVSQRVRSKYLGVPCRVQEADWALCGE